MKIKIIGSMSPINWYTVHIGGEFEVEEHETDPKKYIVIDKNNVYRRLILKADCVVLDAETQTTVKSKQA